MNLWFLCDDPSGCGLRERAQSDAERVQGRVPGLNKKVSIQTPMHQQPTTLLIDLCSTTLHKNHPRVNTDLLPADSFQAGRATASPAEFPSTEALHGAYVRRLH